MYSIIEELGRGGMGCVYKAQSSIDNTIVALKMMSNRVTCYPEYRELFKSEVDTLKRMNHPSVVRIVGEPYNDDAGNYYLPMEFIEGKTIEQHVNLHGAFSLDEAVNLMTNILEALQYVHDRNRIHRDIKPSNIMIRPDGRICIIDFGIAKDARIGGTGKTVGRVIGTDGYMSPEQANGMNIDHRTDIYSIGCVFYYLITGKHAIEKSNSDYATIANILHGNMPIPSQTKSSISSSVDSVFLKSVDKNMMNRYQTASEFKDALLEICGKTIPRIIIGSSSDNDIQINNQYVSRHHLIIKGLELPTTGGATKYAIEITDNNSTNGTGVDGRPLKNSSIVIDYNGTMNMPEVLLAARLECQLNWKEVVTKLKIKGWNPGKIILPPPPPSPEPERMSILIGIACFLLPLIGLILWGVWRSKYPKKAAQVLKVAAIGFVVNNIINLIIRSI